MYSLLKRQSLWSQRFPAASLPWLCSQCAELIERLCWMWHLTGRVNFQVWMQIVSSSSESQKQSRQPSQGAPASAHHLAASTARLVQWWPFCLPCLVKINNFYTDANEGRKGCRQSQGPKLNRISHFWKPLLSRSTVQCVIWRTAGEEILTHCALNCFFCLTRQC